MRADIWVTTESQVFSIDVSFVNPACRSCLRHRTDRYVGRAAKMREEKKRQRQKYGGLPDMLKGDRWIHTLRGRSNGAPWNLRQKLHQGLSAGGGHLHCIQFLYILSAMTARYNYLMLKGARRKLFGKGFYAR
jgi:hypothetical protein